VKPQACEQPIPFGDLVDYWLDERPPGHPSAVEEHLFGCAACSERLESVAALGEAVRRLGREGRLQGGLTPLLLDQLERDGCVIRRYRAASGEAIHCTAGADDDLVVLELSADLADVARVDLLQLASDGDRIRALPTGVLFVRLVAVEPEGERRIGEYTLHHTAYRP
jgi:hypothetical protein